MKNKLQYLIIFYVLQVCVNGLISFNGKFCPYNPIPPSTAPIPFVAVYWADVNTYLNDGKIYYQIDTSEPLLRAAASLFREWGLALFNPKALFVVTWANVTFNGAPANNLPVISHGVFHFRFLTFVYSD